MHGRSLYNFMFAPNDSSPKRDPRAEQSLFLLQLPVGHSSERSNWFPVRRLWGAEYPESINQTERREKVHAKNSNTRRMWFSYVDVISNLI